MDIASFLSPLWLGRYHQSPNCYFELINPRIGYSFSIRYVDFLELYQISYTNLRTNERTDNFYPQAHVDMQNLTYLAIFAATARMQDSDILWASSTFRPIQPKKVSYNVAYIINEKRTKRHCV